MSMQRERHGICRAGHASQIRHRSSWCRQRLARASDAVFAVVDAVHVPGIVQRWKAACAAAEEEARQSTGGALEALS